MGDAIPLERNVANLIRQIKKKKNQLVHRFFRFNRLFGTVLTTMTHRSQIEAKNKKQDKRIAKFNPKGSFEIERNQLIRTRG
jgi:uncharacterized protein YoaH (UPF0181 family)